MNLPVQSKEQPARIPLSRARSGLAMQWLTGAGIIFVVLIVQSVFGAYRNNAEAAWSWALPALMPTLTLIVSVLGANAIEPEDDSMQVRKSFYRISFWVSCCYLSLLLCTI